MPQASPHVPPRPEFIPFTIPYLCMSKPYDGKDFWSYPERCGWIVHVKDTQCHVLCPPGVCLDDMEEVEDETRPPMFSRSDGSVVVASEKAAFLQAWLFFGVLTDVSDLCGLDIDLATEFFLEDGSVSTARLNGLPGRWFEAAVISGRAGDKVLMERILTIARHSHLMLSEERSYDGNTLMFDYSYAECRVFLSLEILVHTVGLHLLLHTYMPGFTTTKEEGWGRRRIERSLDSRPVCYARRPNEGIEQLCDLARDKLEEQGWCESELNLAHQELAFASLLSRPRIRDHSSCGDTICHAYQTEESTYRTRHVDDECSCDFVGLDTDRLIAVLSQNKVLKLVITDELELEVMSENEYPYIALSHVWADGLGNPKINALPRCQLRRLRDYANQLSHVHEHPSHPSSLPIAFWMDTLCIPVHPSELAKRYRKKAIQLLGKTFHEATAVLVLDGELEIVQSATVTFLELGLRILCSGWAKRLWTLQEATLASEAHGVDKLYFQMQDGPFLYQKYDRDRKALNSLDERTTEIQAEERALLYDDGIMLQLGEQIPSVRAMREMRKGWSPFQVIHNATEHQSTSKFEDVPVCIASLLGKDLTTIVSTSDAEQRMANFYMLMREIPIGVLWCDSPEKLIKRPFRWAPKSIGSCPEFDAATAGWEGAICDAAGLHVRVQGFMFAESEIERHGPSSMLPRIFNIVSAETGNTVLVSRVSMGDWESISLQKNLALIHKTRHEASPPNVAVVAIEETVQLRGDDGVHSTEYVGTIVSYAYTLPPNATEAVFQGTMTTKDQRWCLT
ncbi:uncharacterized protein ARMOST_19724 [Armillaria ostoyae]|uniref:Heterokaryon incompatibility domain-containing protein n=1 Tax=Armillaria ostoyae TaxID=47428 RepID=A0A284S5A9_ARMOS|nr:uncharacterized protein ARMOST_19724 [Armillaria ostoyae]